MRNKILLILYVFITANAIATEKKMNAPWICCPSANPTEYGVYHFRKTFELTKVPKELLIDVSADNRYNLFVNGVRVSYGPAKGDLQTYKYDVVDIANYLKHGKNVLAAMVYNGGKDKPLAFISAQTAFMFRCEKENFSFLNSNSTWKVLCDTAYKVISYNELLYKVHWVWGFYACGGGDDLTADKYPWNWEKSNFNDSHWQNSELLNFREKEPWNLVPRNIPFLDNHKVLPLSIRQVTGVEIPLGKWNGKKKLTIPAQSSVTILLDFGNMTMGYPELKVNKGANSSVKIKYAEALYEKENQKTHRDSVNGKIMYGVWDIFRPDGKDIRTFRPLWQRTFRYVQLVIETKENPLEIISFENEYSGYPYPEMATFKCNESKLNKVFDICQRTFQLCSSESYYDTPYYEQLNYGGDCVPVSNISYYNSTDDRLLRETIRLYSQSENTETGLFKSAYPSRFNFDHGTWSMAWIETLHDYYFMRGDIAFVTQFSRNIDRILGYYEKYIDKTTGLLDTIKGKNFIDWSNTKGSIPHASSSDEIIQSTLLNLYYAHSLDCAVHLYQNTGRTEQAKKWENIAQRIKQAVYTSCWDEKKQLFKDYPDKKIYSQQTNIMAILCDVVSPEMQVKLLKKILVYDKFDEMASSYFSYYLFKAMQKTNQEEQFLNNLEFWYRDIDRGLTTASETGFTSHDRSDCHAWSAHPTYFLLNSVCGIKPTDIGFSKILIEPHLGELVSLKATIPHVKGRISVDYNIINHKLVAKITLPNNMTGMFKYNSKNILLNNGYNELTIEQQKY